MSYKALYLTYRPQTFEEVAGQTPIVRTLKNALATGKMAHAYLFAGPRGTGKTTMARLFAKALDCEEGLGHQCNHCSNCTAISEGSHPDVIEIDAASNNGVDQVRDLIDKVKYAPIKGKYKVYIIDEVHMMSVGAFNALLKTLEEPPENVIFILCTTEPYKVLPTILSRCQRFDFAKLTDEEMKGKLLEVLKAEKSEYDDAGVRAIIALADGGMRDALSILDQVLAYSNNSLHEQDVLAIFGLASMAEKIALLKAIRNGDVATVVAKSESFIAGGIDVRRLVGDLIGILKDLLIYEKTGNIALVEELALEEAKELSKIISPTLVNAMIGILVEAQNDFKNVSDVRSLFELTLLRLSSMNEAEKTPGSISPAKTEIHAEAAPMAAKPASIEEKVIPQKEEKPLATPPAAKGEEKPLPPHPEVAPTPAVTPVGPTKNESATIEDDPTNPPDFLFQDEKVQAAPQPKVEPKPAPKAAPKTETKPSEDTSFSRPTTSIDISKILKPAIATEGMEFTLPDDELVKIMVLADKTARTELVKKWHYFSELRGDPKIGNLAALLADGHPFCLCHDAIILSYNFTRRKKEANIMLNQKPLSDLLSQVLGREVFIYAIDRVDTNRITQVFFNLQTVNQLPDKQSVVLHLPK